MLRLQRSAYQWPEWKSKGDYHQRSTFEADSSWGSSYPSNEGSSAWTHKDDTWRPRWEKQSKSRWIPKSKSDVPSDQPVLDHCALPHLTRQLQAVRQFCEEQAENGKLHSEDQEDTTHSEDIRRDHRDGAKDKAKHPAWTGGRSTVSQHLDRMLLRVNNVLIETEAETSRFKARSSVGSVSTDCSDGAGGESSSGSVDDHWASWGRESQSNSQSDVDTSCWPAEETHAASMQPTWVEAAMGGVSRVEANQTWVGRCTPSMGDLACVERCLRELNRVVAKRGRSWQIRPFGSHVNGLSLRGSDLDATCLMPNSGSEDPGGQSAVYALKWILRPLLSRHPSFRIVEQVFAARVPILKLRFENRLEVDLSCHNVKPLRNTGLLHAYVKMSPLVREFILAVKMWAKSNGVCGAAQLKLSTYTFALLALYFLQVDPLVNLPCVPTEAFAWDGERRPGLVIPPWRCDMSLAQLLARFICFYAEQFAWGDEVVSVRLGQRVRPWDPEFASLPYRTQPRIHIEDPFDLRRNLHCVLGAREELELQAAFTQSLSVVPMLDRPLPVSGPARQEFATETLAGLGHHCRVPKAQKAGYTPEPEPEVQPDEEELDPQSHAVSSFGRKFDEAKARFLPTMFDDTDFCFWSAFVGSCFFYTIYAIFSGQLYRLSIAMAALILVWCAVDNKLVRRCSVDTKLRTLEEVNQKGRHARRSERARGKCRSGQAQ